MFPYPIWLRHELRDLVHDVLGPRRRLKEAGFFSPEAVSAIIRDHELMRVDYSRNIWCLLVFMLWYGAYVRGSQVAKLPRTRDSAMSQSISDAKVWS